MTVQWRLRENQHFKRYRCKNAALALKSAGSPEAAHQAQKDELLYALCIGPGSLPKQAAGQGSDGRD